MLFRVCVDVLCLGKLVKVKLLMDGPIEPVGDWMREICVKPV